MSDFFSGSHPTDREKGIKRAANPERGNRSGLRKGRKTDTFPDFLLLSYFSSLHFLYVGGTELGGEQKPPFFFSPAALDLEEEGQECGGGGGIFPGLNIFLDLLLLHLGAEDMVQIPSSLLFSPASSTVPR